MIRQIYTKKINKGVTFWSVLAFCFESRRDKKWGSNTCKRGATHPPVRTVVGTVLLTEKGNV